MICTYKWSLMMPLYEKDHIEYLDDLESKHLDDVLNGKDVILLSRVFSGDGVNYYQFNFDFDFHGRFYSKKNHSDVIDGIDSMSKLLTENKVSHYFEYTPNGVHIVSEEAYLLNKDLKGYNSEKFQGLDYNFSSMRGVVHRFGSFVKGFTIYKSDDKLNIPKMFKTEPINVKSKEEWMKEFRDFLMPVRFSLRSANSIMDNLFA